MLFNIVIFYNLEWDVKVGVRLYFTTQKSDLNYCKNFPGKLPQNHWDRWKETIHKTHFEVQYLLGCGPMVTTSHVICLCTQQVLISVMEGQN